jgi:hypothetical protein
MKSNEPSIAHSPGWTIVRIGYHELPEPIESYFPALSAAGDVIEHPHSLQAENNFTFIKSINIIEN